MGYESYIFVKHDTDVDISTDPASLSGRRIGVLDSAMVDALNTYLQEVRVEAEVVTFPSHETLHEAFSAHEFDVLVAESDGTNWRDHAEVPFPFGSSDYYLCVNKNRPDLLAELNAAQAPRALNSASRITESG